MQANGKKKAVFGIALAILLVAAWGLYRWAAPIHTDARASAPAEQAAGSKDALAATGTVTIKPPRLPTSAKAPERPHSRRNAQTGAPPPLTQPLAGKLMADLADKANQGDTDAAVQLWSDLHYCNYVVSDKSQHDIEDLPNHDMSPQFLNWMLRQNSDLLDNCAGITKKQMDSRYQWLKQAAAEGNPQAKFFYASTGWQDETVKDPAAWDEYKNTAIGYLSDLSEQCDLSALNSLMYEFAQGDGLFDKNRQRSLFYSNVIALLYNHGIDVPADVVSGLSQADMDAAASDASNFVASNCQ